MGNPYDFSLHFFKEGAYLVKKIYVGNLSFSSTETEIENLFSAHGAVESVTLIVDRETGRSRGFSFVEMPNDKEATAAIAALNNYELDGRQLKVNEARPQEDRRSGGGGGGGRGYRSR